MFINMLSVAANGIWPTSFQWSSGAGHGEMAFKWSIEKSAQ